MPIGSDTHTVEIFYSSPDGMSRRDPLGNVPAGIYAKQRSRLALLCPTVVQQITASLIGCNHILIKRMLSHREGFEILTQAVKNLDGMGDIVKNSQVSL